MNGSRLSPGKRNRRLNELLTGSLPHCEFEDDRQNHSNQPNRSRSGNGDRDAVNVSALRVLRTRSDSHSALRARRGASGPLEIKGKIFYVNAADSDAYYFYEHLFFSEIGAFFVICICILMWERYRNRVAQMKDLR